MTEPEFLRPRDLTGPLGVTKDRVYQMIRAGQIPHVVIGDAIRIPRAAWEAWMAERIAEATASIKPKN